MVETKNLEKIKEKIKLIFLSISSLGISEVSLLKIPENEEELEQTMINILSLLSNHKELVRRACVLLEEMKNRNDPIDSYGIVKEYWQNFNLKYSQVIPEDNIIITKEEKENLAIKNLLDLLFYTSVKGKNRLEKQLNCL